MTIALPGCFTPKESAIASRGWILSVSTFGRSWQRLPSFNPRRNSTSLIPSGRLNSCSGAVRNWTRTSLVFRGRRLPFQSLTR